MIRFGNVNEEVYVYRYIAERTFDAYLYQMLENKQRITSQVMTSKIPSRVIEDVDTEVLSYAECKAIATGDPRIMEYCTLNSEINMLNLLKSDYLNQKSELEDKIEKSFPEEIKHLEKKAELFEKDIEKYKADCNKGMELKGILYADKSKAAKALWNVMADIHSISPILIGCYCGFALSVSYDAFTDIYMAHLSGAQGYAVTLGDDARGNITRIDNFLDSLPNKLSDCKNQLNSNKNQLKTALEEVKKPFDREEELQNKKKRFQQLQIDLKLDDRKYTDFDKNKSNRHHDDR